MVLYSKTSTGTTPSPGEGGGGGGGWVGEHPREKPDEMLVNQKKAFPLRKMKFELNE